MAEPTLSDRLWDRVTALLEAAREGAWPDGGQITLNVSPKGQITSVEWKGRDSLR